MRKLVIGCLGFAAFSAMAEVSSFPHNATMTDCNRAQSVTVASLATPVQVPAVNGGMQVPKSVATVYMTNTVIQAMDVEDWMVSTGHIDVVQAAFTLVADENDTKKWMGFTGGNWVQLEGSAAVEGGYDVKIDLDYSLGANPGGVPKIRYSIKATNASESAWVTLKPGSEDWLAIGTTAAGNNKINGIDLYGYVTTGPVWAEAGERAAEGDIAKIEDIGMSYDAITLKVTATDTWGVNNIRVQVAPEGSDVPLTTNVTLAAGTEQEIVFAGVTPGVSYTYQISLTGSYEGTATSKEFANTTVDMFATNGWFSFTGTGFQNATTNDNITIENSKFFATDDELEGAVTPVTTPANVGAVVDTTMEISGVCTELPTFATDAPQFAIALGGTDANRVWMYYSATAPGDTKWLASESALPTTNGLYEGRATFNYATSRVKYEIRPAGSAEPFATLASGVALPNEKTSLAAVAIRGGGSLSKLDATLKLAEPAPIVPQGSTIDVSKNGNLDLANVGAGSYAVSIAPGAHLKWTDAAGKYAKPTGGNQLTVFDGTKANGMDSYHSYILGLDPTVATDKPAAVIKPGESQSGGVKVYVPNITVNTECGYKVMLQRQRSTDGGTSWVDDGEPVDAQNGAVTIPLGDNAVLYRVNTVLK